MATLIPPYYATQFIHEQSVAYATGQPKLSKSKKFHFVIFTWRNGTALTVCHKRFAGAQRTLPVDSLSVDEICKSCCGAMTIQSDDLAEIVRRATNPANQPTLWAMIHRIQVAGLDPLTATDKEIQELVARNNPTDSILKIMREFRRARTI